MALPGGLIAVVIKDRKRIHVEGSAPLAVLQKQEHAVADSSVPIRASRNDRSAPSSDSIVSGRADWNAGVSDRVFLFLQHGQGRTPFHVDPLPVFNDYCNQSAWQGHLSETRALAPTASNQFLLGGSFIDGTCSVANSAK